MKKITPIQTLMILAISFLLASCEKSSHNAYISYENIKESQVFKVTVNEQPVFVGEEHCYGNKTFHTTQFIVAEETTITIESKDSIISCKIYPHNYQEYVKIKGRQISFAVNTPVMMMVEVNDYKPLCLFQTPPEKEVPSPGDKNVLYFGKGIHEAGIINPLDGHVIYLEQGAYVKGRILAENVNNVSIKGRGILDARGFTSKKEKICGIEFRNSNHIKVEGIGIRTGIWWQTLYLLCNDVEISDLNLMSFGENNDGIDIDGVTNFKARNCWIGCGDDGFGWHALDAKANGEPPTRSCIAEDCLIYNAYAGNGLRIGASMETELFEDITFRNIEVITHVNAGIRSDHSDWANIKNLRFENFYIHKPSRPIEMRIEKTRYSNKNGYRDKRGHFDGLYFEGLNAQGGSIVLGGYDEDHLIENVVFKNCFNAGNKVDNLDAIKINKFVNVSFE